MNNWLNIIFSLFMLVICGLYYKEFINPINALKKSLNNITGFVNENSDLSHAELSAKISEDDRLKKTWNLYEKNLVTSYNRNKGKHELYSSVEVAEYFNFTNLCHDNGINISFWQNLGSVFTGVGILGTFFGLSFGIGSLNLGKSEEMIVGIQNLLGGLSTAFYTSLGGIFCALVFSFFHKSIVGKLEKAIHEFEQCLENTYPRKSTEQVLMDALKEQQEQTAQLKKFNTDVAMAISDAIDQKLSESNFAINIKNMDATSVQIKQFLQEELGNVIDTSIQRKMEPIFNDIAEAINKLNNSGLQGVSETIQAGVGEEMQAFSDSLKNMSNSLGSALDEMKNTSKSVNADMNAALEKAINANSDNMEKMAKQTEELQESLHGTSKEIANLVSEIMNNMSGNAKDVQSSMDAVVSKTMEQLQNNMSAMNNNIAEVQKQLGETVVTIGKNMDATVNETNKRNQMAQETMNTAVEESIRKIQESIIEMNMNSAKVHEGIMGTSKDAVKEIINSMEALKESLNAALNEQVSKNKDSNEDFRKIIGQVQSLLVEQGDSYSKINDGVNRAMEKATVAARSFQEASDPVRKATETLVEQQKITFEANRKYQEEIRDSVATLESATENTQDNLKELAKEISDTMSVLNAASQEYREKYEVVNTRLVEMTRTLEEHYTNSSSKILENYQKGLENYNNKFADACTALGNTIDELTDALDDFNANK